jgi:hypothetical protein
MSPVIYTENKEQQSDDEWRRKVRVLAIVTFFVQSINVAWNFLLVMLFFGFPAGWLKESFGYDIELPYVAIANIVLFALFAGVTIRYYKSRVLIGVNILILVTSGLLGLFIGFGDPLM